jgi:hypothetical protein
MTETEPVLRLSGVSKAYGPVFACRTGWTSSPWRRSS